MKSVNAGLVIAHGRSNDMRNPLVRRVGEAAASAGLWALRFNFRYVDAKSKASWKLTAEVDDLLGAIRFARKECPGLPIFAAGKSMGARVCALASVDGDVAGMIALGYPLHPRFRPEVKDPPEWPKIVKPALFVQGDQDPFCDLDRLRAEMPRLTQPHELVVIRNAGHSFEPRGAKRDTFPEVRNATLSWIAHQVAKPAATA
ncbi:MAG: hypothetical protein E6K08_01210 [Methanobacteriota archaeon]|nr:MAG: hypothetical protein E6K08_01210 [Euryarchaeota archaeon]